MPLTCVYKKIVSSQSVFILNLMLIVCFLLLYVNMIGILSINFNALSIKTL
jgi:hypothetical protein